MSEELDQLLVLQWQDAIHRRRVLLKYRRLIPHEPFIESSIWSVNRQLDYLESMVSDKTLLIPAKRRKKREVEDVLGASYWSEWYKTTVALTFLGGRIFLKTVLQYLAAYNRENGDDRG